MSTQKNVEKLLFNELLGSIYWKDKNGIYRGSNDYAAKMVGLKTSSELIGKTDYDLFPPDIANQYRRNDLKVMENGEGLIVEESSTTPEGKTIIQLSSKKPFRDSEGNIQGVIGNTINISRLKQIQAEKEKIEKKLYETEHRLTGMTIVSASIAHELRTPLASLDINVSSLKKYLPQLIQAYKLAQAAGLAVPIIREDKFALLSNRLEAMQQELRSASTFIDMQLVNLSETRLTKNSDEIFSIKDCLENALSRYPFDLGQRELISIDIQHNFTIKSKRALLTHLFFNLIKNALYSIAAARKGHIFIATKEDKHHFIVEFKDTGTGIAKQVLPKIFNRFFTQKINGSGIGLTFCKTVMQALKGDISCQSVEHEYTIFLLFFPKISIA